MGYGLLLLSVIVILFNIKGIIRMSNHGVYKLWGIWTCIAFMNYYFQAMHVEELHFSFLCRDVFVPYICLLVIALELRYNAKRILHVCLIIFLCYSFIAPIFDPFVFMKGEGVESYLGNTYAIVSSITIFLLLLLKEKKFIYKYVFILFLILVLVLIAMTGTRKAFFASLIMVFASIISHLNFKKLSSVFIVIILLVGFVEGYKTIMSHTIMGERMDYLEEQREEHLPPEAPRILKVFGDRSPHYYYGWYQFIKKPILGYGVKQSRVLSGPDQAYIHSEYVAQMCDNGIIGFVIFMLFYINIFREIKNSYRNDRQYGFVLLGCFIALCFMNLTTWSWDMPPIFVALGVLSVPGDLIQ